jgi:hypothetical protein
MKLVINNSDTQIDIYDSESEIQLVLIDIKISDDSVKLIDLINDKVIKVY